MAEKSKNRFKVLYALSLAWQMGFLIAVPIAGFILLGLFLDNLFFSLPLFVIIGAILGISLTFYELYHWLLPFLEEKDNKNAEH